MAQESSSGGFPHPASPNTHSGGSRQPAAAAAMAHEKEHNASQISGHSTSNHHSVSLPSETPSEAVCSEVEWISLLNPKISTRNGQFPFNWAIAIKEFCVHVFHPFSTPLLYFWIWFRKGKQRADTWLHNHIFDVTLSRPFFTRQNVANNMHGLFNWTYYNIWIHLFGLIPMFLAFVRVRRLSTTFDSVISQDYTHEAFFIFFLRACWCAVIGLKYGYYSSPLLKYLKKNKVDPSRVSSEQLLNNWCPDLGRLMFELRVVTSHSPSIMSIHLSVPKKHPAVTYLARCKLVGDQPLCLLPSSSISSILLKLPPNNFHKLFWTRPVMLLDPLGHFDDTAAIDVESYAKYAQEVNLCMKLHSEIASVPIKADQPLNTSAPTSTFHSTTHSTSLPFEPDSGTADQLNHLPIRSLKLESETDELSLKHEDVPAFILMAYAISRANYFGSAWIRPGQDNCRIRYVVLVLTLIFYLIPGVMREVQKQLCTCNNACRSICGALERIEQIRPHYIGHLWGDYILHVLWALGLYFWLPIILSFMCLNLFELFRRAKTIEAWSDILRHGRDRTLSTGMRLSSKDSVMNWYRCREVIYRFRTKIKARLDAVAILLFVIPLALLAALLAMLFTKSGTTPKFFVMCLYISLVFIVTFVMSIHFGSIVNKAQQQELIMLSRLIAYAETLVASKTTRHFGINLSAVKEICGALDTVQATLKTVHTILPEKIFFWLRAEWTVVTSMGVAMFAVANVIYQQVRCLKKFNTFAFYVPHHFCFRPKVMGVADSLTVFWIMYIILIIPHAHLEFLQHLNRLQFTTAHILVKCQWRFVTQSAAWFVTCLVLLRYGHVANFRFCIGATKNTIVQKNDKW